MLLKHVTTFDVLAEMAWVERGAVIPVSCLRCSMNGFVADIFDEPDEDENLV
jgi:hypothetical protein